MCFLFTGSSAAGQSWSTLRNCSNTVSLCAELGNRLLCATFAHASTVSPLIQSIIQSPVWGRKTLPCCLGGGPSTQIIWVEVDTCAAGNNSTLDEEGLPTHWNVKYLLMQHFSEVFAWWNFSLRKVICLVSIFSPWNTHGMNCKLPNVIQVLHFSVCLWTGCCHLKAKNKAKWIVC